MTFDEIIARNEIKREEEEKLDAIRNQRQIAGEIIAGKLFDSFVMSEAEERFVFKCNQAMCPVDKHALSALKKINARRWVR